MRNLPHDPAALIDRPATPLAASHPADEIVRGRPQDAPDVARLFVRSDPNLFRFYGGGNLAIATEMIEHEWRGPRGIYSGSTGSVIHHDGRPICALIGYSAHRAAQLDWDLGTSRAHMAPADWARVRAAHALASYLFPAIPEHAFYIRGMAAEPGEHGEEYCRRLVNWAIGLSRADGCRTCHLDIDSTSPIVPYFHHLGFEILVETRAPSIPDVNPHYRMVKALM